jgi:C4-type Zn-finger protein
MNRLKSVSALLAVSALALVSGVTAQESANAPAQAPATEQAATPALSAEQVPAAPVEEVAAPSISGIPGESIQEGGKFAKIKLSQYVTDEIDKPETIRWAVSGQKQLKVSLKGTEVSIETPDAYWNGTEDLTFTATNSKGKSASETVNFTVESVNNAPEFSKKIPDQTIDEKKQFATIKLDDFIKDVDHKATEMTWETNVVAVGKEQAEGDLSVEIGADRVAKIVLPDPNWYGSADITFTAADKEYATVSTTARFTVKSVNDAPVLKQIPSQTIEEKNTFETINLVDFVSDVDDATETLKWSVSGGKDLKVELDKYGSANIILPNENWSGPAETFTFTVKDSKGAVASSQATFTVKSINDAPEFVESIPDQSIDEKQEFKPIALDKYVRDIDHDFSKLKWTVSGNKDLKVQFAGKEAKVVIPNKFWNGEESLTFKVTDAEGAFVETSAMFAVNSVNDAPSFAKQIPDQTIDEKKQFTAIKLDDFITDPDHKKEEMSWEVSVKHEGKQPDAGTLDVTIGDDRVAKINIPDTYWNGNVVATFTATDPDGASVKQDVKLSVKSINDVPKFTQQVANQTIEEKGEFSSFSLNDYIADADHAVETLKIDVSGNKDLKVNVDKDSREVTVKTPNELWNGEEKVTFTVTDPEGASAKQVVTFTVKSVNDAPVLKEIPAQKIKEKETFAEIALDKYVEDKDHDFSKLKWTVSGNKELKVQVSGKVAKIVIPNKMWHGEETVTFKVSDPEGASAEIATTFTVESVNDVPEFAKQVQEQAIAEKQQFKTIRLDELVKDADHKNEELKWEFDIKPAKGSQEGLQVNVDQNRVATIAIPNKFWNGSAEITFKVSDPEGATASSKATFTVKSVNDAPVFAKAIENQEIQEKQEFKAFNLSELIKDEDHEFGKLKVAVSGNKDLKVNVGKDGTVSVKAPNELWNGTEKVTFTVTDPEGASAKQVVTFTVKSVNDVPVFVKEIPAQKIKEKGEFKTIDLNDFVKDADHPAAKLKWTFTGNKTLKLAVNGERQLKVTIPNKYWNGTEKVTLTVTDPEGAKVTQDVEFTVESVNDKPEFVKQIQDQTIDEKKQFAQIRLRDMVKDFDHKPEDLKWSWKAEKYVEQAAPAKKKGKKAKKEEPESKTSELQVGIKEDGVASILIPNKNWNGAAKITFTVTDPEGATVSSSAIFTVKSVNDAPVISKEAPAGEKIREGEKFKSVLLSSLASDADHSASQLTWAISGNKALKAKINKDNTVTISTPDSEWNGRETLTFTVTDPEGAKATHRMNFEVTPVNDSPKIQKIANQKIKEGGKFEAVRLDQFVKDSDNKPAEMKWTIKNAKDIKKGLKVEITPSRQLQVSAENKHFWCPSQPITLRVADPAGYADTMTVFYEITSVNNPPQMKDIQGQKIKEKAKFREIKLDQFVMDADHQKEKLVWTAKVEKVEAETSAKKAPKKAKGKKNKKQKEEPKVETLDMTVTIDNNRIAYIKLPSEQWHGARKITFTVTDPEGAKDSRSAVFEVESVNDVPVLKAIAPQTIKEKEKFKSVALGELVSDLDHPTSALKFSVAETRNLKVSIDKKNQLVVSVADKFWSGSEKVTVTVTDPEGAKATQQVLYTVQPVNDPPKIAKIAPQTIKEKERFAPIDLSNAAKDPDNKPAELKWTVSGAKDLKVEIKGTRANITTPNTNWYGQETLTFKVSDPSGASDETKVTFKVNAVNDPPFFKQMKPVEIKEKQEFPVINLAEFVKDPDNKISELYFTRDDGEPEGKDKRGRKTKAKAPKTDRKLDYSFSDGKLTVSTPNPNWNGNETVTIVAFDPSGEKASTQVRFVVHPVNDPPQISEIPGEKILEGKAFKTISLDKYVKDPDNKPSEMKWSVSGARMLDVQISGSRVATIKPKKAEWFGSEKITFIVRDPAGITAKTTAEFIIQHVNAVPEMRDIPDYTIKENENGGVLAVLKLNQLARDRDHRFNELKWSFSGNKYLTVTYDKYKNTMTIAQPYSHWKGAPEKITFTVTDPEGAKVSKTAKFTVVAVNNPPVAVAQHYQTQEGTSLNVSEREGLMNGSSDPDNEQAVKVILVNKPKNGSVKLNEKDGSFVYEPKKGFSGIDEFTFKLQDKGGAMSQVQTAEINVTFKLRDVRNQQSAAPVVKKEEDKPKEDKKAKSSKKKSKKKRGKR